MTFSFRPAKAINAQIGVRPIPFLSLYGVDEFGAVINLRTRKALRPAPRARGGYLGVSLHGKTYYVHRLVAVTFHGAAPSVKHTTAHADGNKLNNHFTNIRWATRSENERDKVAHGTSNHGDRNGMSKASQAQRAAQ